MGRVKLLPPPHSLSKPQDGPVSRYFNRYVSSLISRLLLRTSVTPNQVSIAISLLSVPILASGFLGCIFTTGLLLQIASILDGVYGGLARQKNLCSQFGALLDTIVDYWIDSAGVLAIGIALLRKNMLPPDSTLTLVSITIALRLISQFVVKNAPFKKPHVYSDTRDVVTLLIFISASTTELLKNLLPIITALAFINLWRLDNLIYRLYKSWKHKRVETLVEEWVEKGLPYKDLPTHKDVEEERGR